MPSLTVLLALCLCVLFVAHRLYGRLLARWFGLDAAAATPAHVHQDGEDFIQIGRAHV